MAASVRIDDEAFSDARIALLGDLCGFSHYEALGRLAHLWRYCTARSAYVVSPAIVEACLGPSGSSALVAAELGEQTDRGVRIRGTEGRIEWLAKLRANAHRGGAANRKRFETNGEPIGYPNGSANGVHLTNGEPFAYPDDSQTLSQTGAKAEPKPSPPIPIPIPTNSEIPPPPLKKRGRPSKPKLHEPSEAEAASVRVVLDKLGEKSGVRYTGSKAHVALIVGRMRDGYSEMDLRKVIAYCAEQWSRKPEMLPYLRPETLFGPTTIARYIDAARAWFETLTER